MFVREKVIFSDITLLVAHLALGSLIHLKPAKGNDRIFTLRCKTPEDAEVPDTAWHARYLTLLRVSTSGRVAYTVLDRHCYKPC